MSEGSITDKKGGGTIQYNQMETIVFGDGSYIGQKPQEEAPQTIFKVDISAALTDTDGSETLSVVIKNLPAVAELYDVNGVEIPLINGEYNVTVPSKAKDISGSLTMKVPQDYTDEINLQIQATSTEARFEANLFVFVSIPSVLCIKPGTLLFNPVVRIFNC